LAEIALVIRQKIFPREWQPAHWFNNLTSWVAHFAFQMVSNRQKILPRMWQQAYKLLKLKRYVAESELQLINR
jgi:hypothetical protein